MYLLRFRVFDQLFWVDIPVTSLVSDIALFTHISKISSKDSTPTIDTATYHIRSVHVALAQKYLYNYFSGVLLRWLPFSKILSSLF